MKIMQSWDDAVVPDIKVVEVLRKYGAKATFNVNIGLNQEKRVVGWKYKNRNVVRLSSGELPALYEGFEIASHSMTHPDLTICSPEQLKYEVEESRAILQRMFNQPVDGFCYPFGTVNEQVKSALRNAGYTHARGVHAIDHSYIPDDPFELNPHCHFKSEHFCEIFRRLKSENSSFFFFWGHSYEITSRKMLADFEEKIRMLSDDPECEWAEVSDLVKG